jgi:hypothetical protein
VSVPGRESGWTWIKGQSHENAIKFLSGVGIPGIKIGERSGERVRLDLDKETESRECF